MLEERGGSGAHVRLDPEALARLQAQPWPGNVRELRNTVERAVLLGELDPDPDAPAAPTHAVPGDIDPTIPFKTAKAAWIERFERSYVEALIHRCDSNITRATRVAEIDRVYMLRLLDKYGLRPGRTRDP